MKKLIDYSFVIPVFNSDKSLLELYNRIKAEFQDSNFEIIFVEDHGIDQSWNLICEISKNDSRVKGYKLAKNFGQHNALLCGVRNAAGEFTITLDDDLQHPPECIHLLLSKLNEGYDLVYGPPKSEKHGVFRDIASKAYKTILKNSMDGISVQKMSALRVFKTELRKSFKKYDAASVYLDLLLSWSTSNITYLEVSHEKRKYGNSGYTMSKLIMHALNLSISFSTKPLKIATSLGFLMAIFGALILMYILLQWSLYGSSVPGFFFLASIIAIFSGAQLIAIGIIGEYISRIFRKILGEPPFIIKESTISNVKTR